MLDSTEAKLLDDAHDSCSRLIDSLEDVFRYLREPESISGDFGGPILDRLEYRFRSGHEAISAAVPFIRDAHQRMRWRSLAARRSAHESVAHCCMQIVEEWRMADVARKLDRASVWEIVRRDYLSEQATLCLRLESVSEWWAGRQIVFGRDHKEAEPTIAALLDSLCVAKAAIAGYSEDDSGGHDGVFQCTKTIDVDPTAAIDQVARLAAMQREEELSIALYSMVDGSDSCLEWHGREGDRKGKWSLTAAIDRLVQRLRELQLCRARSIPPPGSGSTTAGLGEEAEKVQPTTLLETFVRSVADRLRGNHNDSRIVQAIAQLWTDGQAPVTAPKIIARAELNDQPTRTRLSHMVRDGLLTNGGPSVGYQFTEVGKEVAKAVGTD